MSRLDPKVLFELIAAHVPEELTPHLLIVGSLAAAYEHRDRLLSGTVNTKDADVIIHPAGAIAQAREFAQRLLDAGWRRLPGKCQPSPHPEPESSLSILRLNPPESDTYFLEILGFPRADQHKGMDLLPLELADGWYALPVFRYLGLAAHAPRTAHNGITYAAPEMMALSNLLSHRSIGVARTGQAIEGRKPLRAAKDLGRVLALARLATRAQTEAWVDTWAAALRDRFPDECVELAAHAADGLRALLGDSGALDDAHHTVVVGLLAGTGVTMAQLRATGEQLLRDALEPLASLVR